MDDERQFNRWKQIVSRFKGKLAQMVKIVKGSFHDYSISPKIRQSLLKKQNIDFLYNIKMSVKTLKFGNVIVNKKDAILLNRQLL